MTGSHPCPVGDCGVTVPSSMLMCRRHWGEVPAPLQAAVYRAWRRGEGGGTAGHLQACEDAIAAVERREPERLFG